MHIELARAEARLLPPKWVVLAEDEVIFGPDTLQKCRDFIMTMKARQGASGRPSRPLSLPGSVPIINGGSWRPGSAPRDPESIRRQRPRPALARGYRAGHVVHPVTL